MADTNPGHGSSTYPDTPVLTALPHFYGSHKAASQLTAHSPSHSSGVLLDFSNNSDMAMGFAHGSHTACPMHLEGDELTCPSYRFAQMPLLCTPFLSPGLEAQPVADSNLPDPPAYTETYSDFGHTSGPQCVSPYSASPRLLYSPSMKRDLSEHSFFRQDPGCYTLPVEGNEDEPTCDEPYAQLIYKALMQAPGHRMILRDIYEWFQRNTTKPQESGTNGWQNSIRHNLSMNQAFENDKTDLSNRAGQGKKSNSVWVLTECAIKNGVQSTTRYRKTGNAKKAGLNRVPALQRQRSGAKGGQAARRAAKLRRRRQSELRNELTPSASPDLSVKGLPDPYTTSTDLEHLSSCTPQTPPDDQLLYVPTHPAESSAASCNLGCTMPMWADHYGHDSSSHLHDLGFLSAPDPNLEEVIRFHSDTKYPLIST